MQNYFKVIEIKKADLSICPKEISPSFIGLGCKSYLWPKHVDCVAFYG